MPGSSREAGFTFLPSRASPGRRGSTERKEPGLRKGGQPPRGAWRSLCPERGRIRRPGAPLSALSYFQDGQEGTEVTSKPQPSGFFPAAVGGPVGVGV